MINVFFGEYLGPKSYDVSFLFFENQNQFVCFFRILILAKISFCCKLFWIIQTHLYVFLECLGPKGTKKE